jgi:hypothetical protein
MESAFFWSLSVLVLEYAGSAGDVRGWMQFLIDCIQVPKRVPEVRGENRKTPRAISQQNRLTPYAPPFFLQYILVGLEFSAPLANPPCFCPEEVYFIGAFR